MSKSTRSLSLADSLGSMVGCEEHVYFVYIIARYKCHIIEFMLIWSQVNITWLSVICVAKLQEQLFSAK